MTTSPDTVATPDPGRTADRSRLEGLLRDIYAVAAFFTAHPLLPTPWNASFSIEVHTPEDLKAMAEYLGVTRIYADGTQFDYKITQRSEDCDREISVIVALRTRDKSRTGL
jgi:hypothetical protein